MVLFDTRAEKSFKPPWGELGILGFAMHSPLVVCVQIIPMIGSVIAGLQWIIHEHQLLFGEEIWLQGHFKLVRRLNGFFGPFVHGFFHIGVLTPKYSFT